MEERRYSRTGGRADTEGGGWKGRSGGWLVGRFLGGQLLEKSIRGDAGEFLQSQNQPGPHLMLPFAQSYVRPFPSPPSSRGRQTRAEINVEIKF